MEKIKYDGYNSNFKRGWEYEVFTTENGRRYIQTLDWQDEWIIEYLDE